MGHDVRTPTVSMALDLSLELRAFLLELESCFLDLLASEDLPKPNTLTLSHTPTATMMAYVSDE